MQLTPQLLPAPVLPSELDAIAVAILEETGQQAQRAAAPPASKKAVRALPRWVGLGTPGRSRSCCAVLPWPCLAWPAENALTVHIVVAVGGGVYACVLHARV